METHKGQSQQHNAEHLKVPPLISLMPLSGFRMLKYNITINSEALVMTH